jgi:hypothetical protein
VDISGYFFKKEPLRRNVGKYWNKVLN